MKYKSSWLAALLLPLTLFSGVSEAKIQQMAGNGYHSLFITGADHVVYAAGQTQYGQIGPAVTNIGSSSTTNYQQLTAISTGIANAAGVATNYTGSVVLLNDGTVYYFGATPTGTPNSTPVLVPGSGYTDIAATLDTVYLLKGGQVFAWGKDPAVAPTLVPGLSNVTMIDGSYYHMVALDTSGSVWTKGLNPHGQFGNGTLIASATPYKVTLSCLAKEVSAGETQTAIVCQNGDVWSWGAGNEGQRGNNTTADSLVPVQATISNVVSVQAGRSYTAALKIDGTMWAWGWHDYIGGASYNMDLLPIMITELGSNVAKIGGCADHTMTMTTDGTYRNWGGNLFGKLGDGTNTERHAPTPVVYDPTVVAITIGAPAPAPTPTPAPVVAPAPVTVTVAPSGAIVLSNVTPPPVVAPAPVVAPVKPTVVAQVKKVMVSITHKVGRVWRHFTVVKTSVCNGNGKGGTNGNSHRDITEDCNNGGGNNVGKVDPTNPGKAKSNY